MPGVGHTGKHISSSHWSSSLWAQPSTDGLDFPAQNNSDSYFLEWASRNLWREQLSLIVHENLCRDTIGGRP